MRYLATTSLSALLATAVPAGAQDNAEAQAAVAAAASGSQVTVAPLRLELEGEQRAETLRLHNPSNRPIGVQVRAFHWDQMDNEDRYSPANDLQVTPSIIMIEPGETQVFRVVRREQPPQGERRYRIAVDQLPDPERTRPGMAATRIRLTIPVFVDRDKATPPQLGWSIAGNALRLENSGQQTARLVNLNLVDGAGRTIAIADSGMRYILGGKVLNWKLPGGCPTGPVRISVMVDGETVDAQVPAHCS